MYYLQIRYYDPEMGRFISSDDAAMSMNALEDITAANLFAYCGNDPVNRVDPSGYDAVWLQDTNAVGGAGHTGLLIAIKRDVWWHFYWGLDVSYAEFKWHFTNLKDLNNILFKLGLYGKQAKNRSKDGYEKYIYFSGDFKQSHKQILIWMKKYKVKTAPKGILTLYKSSKNPYYHLLIRNCMQYSASALAAGVRNKWDNLHNILIYLAGNKMVPNSAYNYLVKRL